MPRCPSCFTLMSRVQEPQYHYCTCSNCFGNWSPKPNLLHWVMADPTPSETSADEPSLKDLAALVAESDSKKPFQCPECRQTLRIGRLHLMIPINVQECIKCGCVWTDVGKRPLIKKLFHAMKTSTDPRIVSLRERCARVEATSAVIDAQAAKPMPQTGMINPGSNWISGGGYSGGSPLNTLLDILIY